MAEPGKQANVCFQEPKVSVCGKARRQRGRRSGQTSSDRREDSADRRPGEADAGPATRHGGASGSGRSALRGPGRLEWARPLPPAASFGRRHLPPHPAARVHLRAQRERQHHSRLRRPEPTTAQPPSRFPPSPVGTPIGQPRGPDGSPLDRGAAISSRPPPHPPLAHGAQGACPEGRCRRRRRPPPTSTSGSGGICFDCLNNDVQTSR